MHSSKYTKLLDPGGVQSADDELKKLGQRVSKRRIHQV
jgi:hypothetical protein